MISSPKLYVLSSSLDYHYDRLQFLRHRKSTETQTNLGRPLVFDLLREKKSSIAKGVGCAGANHLVK